MSDLKQQRNRYRMEQMEIKGCNSIEELGNVIERIKGHIRGISLVDMNPGGDPTPELRLFRTLVLKMSELLRAGKIHRGFTDRIADFSPWSGQEQ